MHQMKYQILRNNPDRCFYASFWNIRKNILHVPKKTSAAVQKRVKNQRAGMRVEAGSDLTFALPAGIRQHGSEEESTTGTTMAKKSGKNVYLVALLLFLGGVG